MSQSRATRTFAVAVTLFIALAAAALSYDHALIVAEEVGTEPPLALIVAIEVLIGIFRRGRSTVLQDSGRAVEPGSEPPEAPPVQVALARLTADYSQRELAAALSISRSHLQRHWPRPDQAAMNGSGHA